MSTPELLLVDIDNTLYPYRPCFEAGIAAAQRVGATFVDRWSDTGVFMAAYAEARARVKQAVGAQASSHCRLLYFKRMIEDAEGRTKADASRTIHDAYWTGYFSRMVLAPDCRNILESFVRDGIRIVWLTSYTTERQMLKLMKLGLAELADYLIATEEIGIDKPSPKTIDYAIARADARRAATWMIGDDPDYDVPAARSAGITAVWFKQDDAQPREQPDYTVASWKELGDIVRRSRARRHAR